jgi:hypothetical protein
MSTRKDICTPRKKKDGGTYWVKIGTAWEKDGKTQLVFDALPIPDGEGRVVANLFEPRDNSAPRAGSGFGEPRQRYASADLDDGTDAPF